MTESTTDEHTLAVTVDTTECCASGMCAAIAPQVFGIDAAGYAVVLATADSIDDETLMRAARNCPTLCIALYRDGTEIDLFA